MKTFPISAAVLLLSISTAFAAPCNTGDKGKTPDQSASANSSASDQSSKNTAGGNQPASPGTVGAMNNLGPNQGVTGQGGSDGKDKGKEDPAAKNTAGGNQPASPGTVGAMNNAEKPQTASKGEDC